MNREEILKRYEKLYSAVIADSLDKVGHHQTCMSLEIRPITMDMVVCGWAMTAQGIPVAEEPEEPYKGEFEAVDSLKPGDVFVGNAGGAVCGFWGELLSNAALARGARGAVVEGFTRDSVKIVELGFPVFVSGYNPYDSLSRCDVIKINEPITCGGILVRPGDLVFGDVDGIVVVPSEVAEEVLKLAEEKVTGENEARVDYAAGMSTAEVFKKHGIL
jgi:regulator of RNase E activity RraA